MVTTKYGVAGLSPDEQTSFSLTFAKWGLRIVIVEFSKEREKARGKWRNEEERQKRRERGRRGRRKVGCFALLYENQPTYRAYGGGKKKAASKGREKGRPGYRRNFAWLRTPRPPGSARRRCNNCAITVTLTPINSICLLRFWPPAGVDDALTERTSDGEEGESLSLTIG